MDGDMLCAASMRCMEQHRRAASPWVRLAGRDGTVVQVEPHIGNTLDRARGQTREPVAWRSGSWICCARGGATEAAAWQAPAIIFGT